MFNGHRDDLRTVSQYKIEADTVAVGLVRRGTRGTRVFTCYAKSRGSGSPSLGLDPLCSLREMTETFSCLPC